MDISTYIAVEAQKPFRWGETDCLATADRWLFLKTGHSPLLALDCQYRTQQEADQLLQSLGGFAVAVNRSLRTFNFQKTEEPKSGDIGLVKHKDKLCMAIHAGEFWFTRDQDGMMSVPLKNAWKAWRI